MNADRSFGFVVGGALALVGSALVLAGSRLAGPVLGGAGALLLVLGVAAPVSSALSTGGGWPSPGSSDT